MPDLEKELISVSELGFIDKISESKKVLIHNDFYPGNIIIDDKITYGIDLAKSGFGFQFMDVATLFGWFELPARSFSINFSEKDGRSFQKLFLETYCALSELNYTKTRQELNKFLAKVFLDQTDICATLATKAWNYIDSTAKNDPKKKINALLQKAKNYATGG